VDIKDFQLLRFIGQGGFSKVYLVQFKDRQFALKVIRKDNTAISSDPESAFTEMKALTIGRDYPFLSIVHCCFQSVDRLYFVMEYVAGKDLRYHLSQSKKFTEERVKFHSAEIVLALRFLHRRGIIYRDLKSENIIIDSSGHCKLIDFGMSKEVGETKRARTFCGTPDYIAPEIIDEQEYDYSVDWWALGVLMYEMMFGILPFSGERENQNEIYSRIRKEEVFYPQAISSRSKSILQGLMNKNPLHRLGCQSINGYSEAILCHPFFMFKTDSHSDESFQWDAIESKRLNPPFRLPPADSSFYEDEEDLKRNQSTKLDLSPVRGVTQDDFKGFSYCSQSFKELIP